MRQVFILIGPKGAGKSHIGRLLQQEMGIQFIDVEPIFLAYRQAYRQETVEAELREPLRRIRASIDELLQTHEAISFETTAATPLLLEFISELKRQYTTCLIRVNAPLDICLDRVASRDQTVHLPAPEELVTKVYEITTGLRLDFDVELDNVGLSDAAILRAVSGLVG